MDFDVAVVGGGPGGTSAAIALAHAGARVLVVERTRYEKPRIGETLPPVCKTALARLGVWERFLACGHRAAPCVLSAWGGADLVARDSVFDPYGEGWHIDRRAFDAMLAERAEEAGAVVWRDGRLTGLSGRAGAFRLGVSEAGSARRIEARHVIDATGRAASVATRLGAERIAHDRLVGLVAFLPGAGAGDRASEATLIETEADGWWYSAPLPDGSLVAAFMTDESLLPRGRANAMVVWQNALARSTHTRARIGANATEARVSVVSARTLETRPAAGEGWTAVGDAALAMDPLSSGGVFEALRSGLAAAGEIAHGDRAGDYTASVAARVAAYLVKRERYYRQELRWPSSAFWSRRRS